MHSERGDGGDICSKQPSFEFDASWSPFGNGRGWGQYFCRKLYGKTYIVKTCILDRQHDANVKATLLLVGGVYIAFLCKGRKSKCSANRKMDVVKRRVWCLSLCLTSSCFLVFLPVSCLCRHYYVVVVSVVWSRLPSAAFTLTFDLCLSGFCSTVFRSADAEIKAPFRWEPRPDKWSPLKAWSQSECSHACFAHCQELLPCPNFYLPSPKGPFAFILCNYVSSGWLSFPYGPRNKLGHPAQRSQARSPCSVVTS